MRSVRRRGRVGVVFWSSGAFGGAGRRYGTHEAAVYRPDNIWEILRWHEMHEAVSASAAGLHDYLWPAPPAGVLSTDLMELLHNRLAVRVKRTR